MTTYQNITLDDTSDQMHQLLREMASFVALYETMEEKLISREEAIEEKARDAEQTLTQQLSKIKSSLTDFQNIMTAAGAARLRVATEKALNEGKLHLQTMQETCADIGSIVKDGAENLNQVATQAVTNLTEASASFRAKEFTKVAEEGAEKVKSASETSIKRISELINWFQWKNVAMAFAVTVFVIFMTGLYINDEWPWEIHKNVVKERKAGEALLAAWPYLTPQEQQHITVLAKQNPVS